MKTARAVPAPNACYLLAPRVFDGEGFVQNAAVLVQYGAKGGAPYGAAGGTRDGRIAGVLAAADIPPGADCVRFNEGALAPGFIDTQVNGGGGALFNDEPAAAALEKIARAHRGFGTTGIMPTLISDAPEVCRAGAEAARECRKQGRCGVLGAHLEGPHLAPPRRGVHRAAMLRSLREEDAEWLASLSSGSDGMPVMLTLAPERVEPGIIKRLSDAGVLVCAGHTEADYERMQSALAEGLRGFTHLFNGMNPLRAREPGAVGAALDSDHAWLGIIADGCHVHPANIRLAHRAKAPGKLMLVSDAMPIVGSGETSFELYGERIELRGGKLQNADGALAGSAIGMMDAVRYCHREVGIPLAECLRMASLYPAQFLKLDGSLGRIAAGYRADLVLFDDELNVRGTWVAGEYAEHASAAAEAGRYPPEDSRCPPEARINRPRGRHRVSV